MFPLVVYVLVYPMRSHIHASNMAWEWLAERQINLSLIYGRVVRGSPWIGWLLHKLITVIFLMWFMSTCTCYYVDSMVVFSWLMLWLYDGYIPSYVMCSSYGSYSWFDKYLNGWWMHGLTSVDETTWEEIRPSWWFSDEVKRFMIRYAFMTYSLHVYHVFDKILVVY